MLGTHTGTAGASNHTGIMPGEELDPGSISDAPARTHLNEILMISDHDEFPENNLHDTATQFQYTLQNDTPSFDSVSPADATTAQPANATPTSPRLPASPNHLPPTITAIHELEPGSTRIGGHSAPLCAWRSSSEATARRPREVCCMQDSHYVNWV